MNRSKFAFFSLAARGEGHFVQPYSHDNRRDIMPSYITLIRAMLCSFRLWNSRHPMIVIAVNLTARERADLLQSGASRLLDPPRGFDIRDHLPSRPQPPWQPNCTGYRHGRPDWTNWNRKDMHKTLFKFLVWTQTAFEVVAFVDADQVFLGNPDAIFHALMPKTKLGRGVLLDSRDARGAPPYLCTHTERMGVNISTPACASLDFVADGGERPGCRRYGWTAGLFVTRPSEWRFARLLNRTRLGDFPRYTNTEQDVLDAEFAAPQCPGRPSLLASQWLSDGSDGGSDGGSDRREGRGHGLGQGEAGVEDRGERLVKVASRRCRRSERAWDLNTPLCPGWDLNTPLPLPRCPPCEHAYTRTTTRAPDLGRMVQPPLSFWSLSVAPFDPIRGTAAYLYWAYVATIAVHHRRKDDARAAALAEGVCSVRPRTPRPALFGRMARGMWDRNVSLALRLRLEGVLRATARSTVIARPYASSASR